MKKTRISTYIILMMLTCSVAIPSFMGMPIQEPMNIELIDQLEMTYPNTHKVITDGGYGYVLSYKEDPSEGALDIIDLGSSPPTIIGTCLDFTFPSDIFVNEGYAYVLDQANSNHYYIYKIDVHDPTSPEFTDDYLTFSNLPSQMPFFLTLYESQLYIYHCLSFQDYRLSVYALPSLTQEASISLSIISEHMTIQDYLVYMIGYSHEAMDYVLEIYNVTDMTTPERISQISCMDGPQDIDVVDILGVGTFCYLPGEDCFEILEVTNPLQIPESTLYPLGSAPVSVTADQMFLYVSFGVEGLYMYNIGEPEGGSAQFPSVSGTFNTSGSAVSLDVMDRYICIADGENGLSIVQFLYLETPQQPSGLSFGSVETSHEFQMVIPESLEEEVYVLWHWGDGTTTNLGPFLPGEIVTATHTWISEADYPVKVKIKTEGAESLWSQSLIFAADDPNAWGRSAHNFKSTGFTSGDAPNQLTLKWSTIPNIGGYTSTDPIVFKDHLFLSIPYSYFDSEWGVSLYRSYVVCQNATTGQIEWEYSLPEREVINTQPIAYEGCIYFITSTIYRESEGIIEYWLEPTYHIINISTGETVFSRSYSYGEKHSFNPIYQLFSSMSSPVIYDGKLYTFMEEEYIDENLYQRNPKYVCCFNASNGDILWTLSTGGYVTGKSLAVYNDRLYFGSSSSGYDAGRVFCIDPHGDGQGSTYVYWSYYTPEFYEIIRSDVVLYRDQLFFTTSHDRFISLDADDGSFLWDVILPTWSSGPVSAGYGCAYIGGYENIICIDIETREIRWQVPLEGTVGFSIYSSHISLADGNIYVGTYDNPDNYFLCINATDGDELWRFYIDGSSKRHPAIANGNVYVALSSSRLLCFGGENHSPTKPLTPLGPDIGNAGAEYFFSTSSTDPDSNDIQYGWDWDGDLEVDEWTDFYLTGEVVDTSHIWDDPGVYQVHVIARDVYDGESEWSDPLVIEISLTEPELEIGEIKGGIGLKVEIINVGDFDATDIEWSMSIDGGLILAPQGGYAGGSVDGIPIGEDTTFRTGLILGIGRPSITIDVVFDGSEIASKTVNAVVLGIFVIITD